MTASTHRTRAVAAGVIAGLILLLGFAAGWVGKVASDERADQATNAAKAVADPVVEQCESNTAAGEALRADDDACPVARQVQKAVEGDREPVLVPVMGPQGPRGLAGPVGPVGPSGVDGRDGKPGKGGRDGLNGTDGTDGLAGANGSNGSDGVNGIDGQNGTDGTQGPEGPQGPAGPEGPEGPAGPAGQVGPMGPSGIVTVTQSEACTQPAPLAVMTFQLAYDPATGTLTLICSR